MMKFVLAGAMAAMILSACGPSAEESTAGEAVTGAASSQALSSGTWHFISRENCMDIYMRTCTSTFPSPQCPSSHPEGTSCTIGTGACYVTISGGWFDDYACY